jgi:Domain of unknown function (DUF4352)
MWCVKCGNLKNGADLYCAKCGTRYPNGDDKERRKVRGPVSLIIKWSGVLCVLAACYVLSMIVYPVVIVVLGIPILLVLTNLNNLRQRTVDTWLWRHWQLPWTKTVTPTVGATVLGLWILTTSASGYAMYSHNAHDSAQHTMATQTTAAQVSGTARAYKHEAALVRTRAHATALAVTHKTRVAHMRVTATAQALAHKKAAPRQTAVAAIKAIAHAAAQFNAQVAANAPVVHAVASYHAAVHKYYGAQHDGSRIPSTSTGEAQLAVDCIATNRSNSYVNTNSYITYQVLGFTVTQVSIKGSSATLVENRHDIITFHKSDGSSLPNDSTYTATYTLDRSSGSWLVSDYSWTASDGSSGSATADAQACSNPPTAPPVVQPTTSAAGAANASGGFSDPATQMQVTVSNVQRTTGYTNQPQVVFYVSITNNGSSSHDYNPLDFTCVDEGNQEHSGDSLLQSPFSDARLSSGALAPGDSRAGWVGCDMPSGSRLRVTWDDAFNLQPTEQVWP